MTLQNLKYVVAVAEHGSFSAAAKALYISQSTLSSAIKELEAELELNSSCGVTAVSSPPPTGRTSCAMPAKLWSRAAPWNGVIATGDMRLHGSRFRPSGFPLPSGHSRDLWSSSPGTAMISPSGSAQPIPLLVTWLLEKVMWGWWPCTTSTFQHWKRPLR